MSALAKTVVGSEINCSRHLNITSHWTIVPPIARNSEKSTRPQADQCANRSQSITAITISPPFKGSRPLKLLHASMRIIIQRNGIVSRRIEQTNSAPSLSKKAIQRHNSPAIQTDRPGNVGINPKSIITLPAPLPPSPCSASTCAPLVAAWTGWP